MMMLMMDQVDTTTPAAAFRIHMRRPRLWAEACTALADMALLQEDSQLALTSEEDSINIDSHFLLKRFVISEIVLCMISCVTGM